MATGFRQDARGRPRGATTPLLLLLLLFAVWTPSAAQHEDNVRAWAEELGDELWRLGKIVTKFADMKKNYQYHNVQVHEKDGATLLDSIVKDVSIMLARKVEAVRCIMMAAEEVANEFEYNSTTLLSNFKYYSAKYSSIYESGATEPIVPEFGGNPKDRIYNDMYLGSDPHFYNIPVNTTHSCVHVPTNVFDKAADVLPSIMWSKGLDDMFIQNYKSDPSLSWQFFGLSTGVMRSYPAFQWRQDVDVFDCRTRFWFIEAATCTKDMIILLDNTGSMKGIRDTIAKLTVYSILDTLSNNDFVNVLYFNNTTYETVSCFKKTLVQATLENINLFKSKVSELKTLGAANFTQVFIEAFEILEQYREERGCNDDSEGVQCNQAIMLITDGLPGNLTEVFERYNRKSNNTFIPVRIFTFLVGREVTKVREIQWLACLNRGYYVHINLMTEVREQVLKYINVIARPLVLQGTIHPVVWTHAYADTKDPKIAAWLRDVMDSPEKIEQLLLHERNKGLYFSQQKEDSLYIKEGDEVDDDEDGPKLQAYRLMTSVAIPAFDTKANRNMKNRTANILGVAGTDVPLDDIERRASSYKIGVNGYPFIVTNNGYILIHPDLRPVSQGVLKDNYNSVDFSEVELMEEDVWARESNTSSAIFQLREALISHTVGSMRGLRVKYHYDDMKRVAIENRDYFYAPLTGTPFTMGIALPEGYGFFRIGVGDVLQTIRQQSIPVAKFFSGSNWKIHPDWLYCKYNHDSYQVFKSSEEELLHFLQKMSSEDWKWRDLYEHNFDDVAYESWTSLNHTVNCTRQPAEEGGYYCDEDLMQLLLFDAEVTEPYFRDEKWTYRSKADKELVESYKVTLRFVATHSGLTRWDHVEENEESIASGMEFGDLHTHGIDEAWYKSAVLQHQINQESFVFSVPFAAGDSINTSVTASYAVFPRDGGKEAPASVVGLQFHHSSLRSRFFSITDKKHCATCQDTCTSGEFDCYILDNNGYVIVSETMNDTGRFFGEIDGAVFEAMKFNGFFKKIRIYDYQSLCFEETMEIVSAANILLTPLHHLMGLMEWLLGQLLWFLFQSFHMVILGDWTVSFPLDSEIGQEYYPDYYVLEEVPPNDTLEDDLEELGRSSSEYNTLSIRIYNVSEPCDVKINLYLLQQQEDILQKGVYKSESPLNGARPFSVRLIPHTNLLLLVVDALRQGTHKKFTVAPKEIHYNDTEYPCQKVFLNSLPRRKLLACYSEHPEEVDIKACGDGIRIAYSTFVITVCCIIASVFHWHH